MNPGGPSSPFDEFSQDYDQRLDRCLRAYGGRDSAYYHQLKVRRLRELTKKFKLDPGTGTFLDLGCGAGQSVAALAPDFRFGAGLDRSPGMIRSASRGRPPPALVLGDACALPFADHSFDLVFSITLLHHLGEEEISRLLSEVKRVLRPGGLTVHFDHNPYNFLTRRIVQDCEFDPHATLRPAKRIARLAARQGLIVRECGYLVFVPAFLKFLEPLEKLLKPLPLGGQYFLAATS